MDNNINPVGLALVALLTLIFLVFVVIAIIWITRIVICILTAYFEHRRAEAKRVTVTVPGLGVFTSTDNTNWFGDVEGLQVMITTDGRPPGDAHARWILAVVEDLPRLVELARKYLEEREDCKWLEGGPELFEAESLDMYSEADFSIIFGHPADSDGMYSVQFHNGVPIDSKHDD